MKVSQCDKKDEVKILQPPLSSPQLIIPVRPSYLHFVWKKENSLFQII